MDVNVSPTLANTCFGMVLIAGTSNSKRERKPVRDSGLLAMLFVASDLSQVTSGSFLAPDSRVQLCEA